MTDLERREAERLRLQSTLDDAKTSEYRNRMGQYATPTALAREILAHGIRLLPHDAPIRFLDPAIGTGSFYSALLATTPAKRIKTATGYEVDPHYGEAARAFWKDTALDIRLGDFARAKPDGRKANLLICNPPYVRHHHMDAARKAEVRFRAENACGVKINGLSGLYCYFAGLSHPFMADGGIAGWLIPSEFMGVNYGWTLKRYLLEKVTLLQIHRFDPEDAQFEDALVSSAVVWFKNTPRPKNHSVLFTYGGTLSNPALSRRVPAAELTAEPKWTRYPRADKPTRRSGITLGDLFDIKRGLVTGDNGFFIMDRARIREHGLPIKFFQPVLPSSRFIPEDEIKADARGLPLLSKQLFLLNTCLDPDEIAARHPALSAYLESGKKGEKPVADRYLCRSRKPWYAQEIRPAAPIVCTYMGRNRPGAKPFRFMLNHSVATACNVFLMLYPKPILKDPPGKNPHAIRLAWEFLSNLDTGELLSHGRVYGGGLHKLEPKELRGFPAEDLARRLGLESTLPARTDLFVSS